MGYTGAIAAIAGLLLAPALPEGSFTHTALSIFGLFALIVVFSWWRYRVYLQRIGLALACFVLGFAWSAVAIELQQDSRWPASQAGEIHQISGRIADLPAEFPEYTRFIFAADDEAVLGGRILVYWYRSEASIQSGQRWSLPLKLKPPRGTANFAGFDRERWLFANRIVATGVVQSEGKLISDTDVGQTPVAWVRTRLREKLRAALSGHPQQGLILGLALGDRSGISSEQWQRLQTSGTGHLLAISGLHIGLAGLFGFFVFRGLGLLLSGRGYWNPQRLGWLGSVLVAFVYLLLSGTVLSASRAMLMLGVAVAALLLRRNIDPWFAYLLALLVNLFLWPLSSLTPGFWLSFGAVGLLIYAFQGRRVTKQPLRSLIRAQIVLAIGLLPLTIAWFHYSSAVAALANLIAVPLLSFVVVPLVLLSLLLVSMPVTADAGIWLLQATAGLLGVFDALIDWVSQWSWSRVFWPEAGLLSLCAATLGALWLLAPRGWPARGLGLALMLPLLLPRDPGLDAGELRLLTLDVGQGLALIAETDQHTLVYDTGPGDGLFRHQVWSTVVPNLMRGRPDMIVSSHADLDHAGGLQALRDFAPRARLLSSAAEVLPEADCRTTSAPMHWDGFRIRILHPNPGLPYLGNDSSCVISIDSPRYEVLLPGDIGEAVEARLLNGLRSADEQDHRHRILVVPHHGSLTSSSPEFVQAVRADLAIISAGYANRFNLPKQAVIQRYLDVDSRVLNTADCGALEVRLQYSGVKLSSARRTQPSVWRYPPAEGCP